MSSITASAEAFPYRPVLNDDTLQMVEKSYEENSNDEEDEEDDDGVCIAFIQDFQSMNVIAASDASERQPPSDSDCCSPCTLQYVDGFPLWKSFPLFSVFVAGERYVMVASPVF